MLYTALKHSHMLLVTLSVALFFTRFICRELNAGFIRAKFFKIAPHIIDTLLLASGVGLIILVGYSLWPVNWLTVKITLVIAYILSGFAAMKVTSKGGRWLAALCALLCVMGILHLALAKNF